MNKHSLSLTILLGLGLLALASSLVYAPLSSAAAPSAQPAAAQLSAVEVEHLLYMREEEKLAHDVYVTLDQKWGLPIFDNISGSEATHMAAVKTLLDQYGLADPTAGKALGEFTDPKLQSLYDQLVAQGTASLGAALRVGAAIEEIDILDLQEALAETDHQDISRVYSNLEKGSRNHLRSFVSTLSAQTGETYAPQYLTQDAFDQIVSASKERGPAGR